jgi:Rad3-related DNA helicase
VESKNGSVLISPSMMEGFDFVDDLARWQAIIKVPWSYLGDRQVAAKKDQNPEWYDTEAIKAIIQTCGRPVRSKTDHAVTYILDSDFSILWEKYGKRLFPKWWTDATVWE